MELKTGKRIWQKELQSGTYWSSVVLAADRLYFSNDKGYTTVLSVGREAEVLEVNKLDNGIYASPAVVESGLIVRTTRDLYCISKSDSK